MTNANCPPGAVSVSLGGIARGGYCCTPTGPEVCDGLDNDCDGFVDGRLAASSCDDKSACTKDYCRGGACQHQPVVCTDTNACTENSCDPLLGCVTTPTDCDDGNLCTIDACLPKSGCTHTPVTCTDDGDQCTQDLCDSETGECIHPVVPDGTLCDDGIACTSDEFCFAGTCGSGLPNCPQGPNLCVRNLCDFDSGECQERPVLCPSSSNPLCFETLCVVSEGICETFPITGPGFNPECSGASACATNADCEDNDACTAEVCEQDGAIFLCKYPATNCNDLNPCTDDFCDPRYGCFHFPYNPILLCGDDGLACTTQVCDPARDGCATDLDDDLCDDGLSCTVDLCDADLGCTHSPDPSLCGNGVCDLGCLEHAGNCATDCIGENSCIGDGACAGVTGQIGANSCHGNNACASAGGNIGDNSCYSVLLFSSGACTENTGNIGNNSCIGEGACTKNSGTVGDDSCRSTRACCGNIVDIGDGQCNNTCECIGPESSCVFDCGG